MSWNNFKQSLEFVRSKSSIDLKEKWIIYGQNIVLICSLIFIGGGLYIEHYALVSLAILAIISISVARILVSGNRLLLSLHLTAITFTLIYMLIPILIAPLFSPILGLLTIWYTALILFKLPRTRTAYSIIIALCLASYLIILHQQDIDNSFILILMDIVMLVGTMIYLLLMLNVYLRSVQLYEASKTSQHDYLNQVFNASHNYIYTKDTDLKFSLVNDRFAQLIGMDKAQIVGKTGFELGLDNSNEVEDFEIVTDQVTRNELQKRLNNAAGEDIIVNQIKIPIKRMEDRFYGVLCIMNDITSNELMNQELKQMTIQFETLFEKTPIGVAIRNIESNKFVSVNSNMVKLLGYSKEELLDIDRDQLTYKDDEHDINENVQKLLNNEISYHQSLKRFIKRNGELVWVKVYRTLININETPHIIGIVENVNNEIIYREALQKSEDRYRVLVESSPDAIVSGNLKGEVTFASSMARKLFGYSESDKVIGSNLIDYLQLDELPRVLDLIRQLFEQKKTEKFNAICKKKDGSTFLAEAYCSPLLDDDGEMIGGLVIARDVTEQESQKEKLIASEKRYRSLFEESNQGILILNSDFEILHGNPSSMEYLQVPDLRTLQQKRLKTFYPSLDHRKIVKKLYSNRNQPLSLKTLEGQSLHERFLLTHITFSLQEINDRERIICMLRDVTQLYEFEQQEKELENQKTLNHSLQRELTSNSLIRNKHYRFLDDLKIEISNILKQSSGFVETNLNKVVRTIDNNLNEKDDWISFKLQFEKVHPYFFQNISSRHAGLTVNDLKHCAYIKLHMSSQDVSNLLFIEKKSVEMTRYRLKKKLGLKKEDKLNEYVLAID